MDPLSLTAFLAPFLPHLLKGLQASTEDAGRELGDQAWEAAKRLWGKLRPRVEERPAAAAAADALAKRPDDELTQSAVAFQLREILDADAGLKAELEQIWREIEPTVIAFAAERGVAIVGDVTGSTIITGDNVDNRS